MTCNYWQSLFSAKSVARVKKKQKRQEILTRYGEVTFLEPHSQSLATWESILFHKQQLVLDFTSIFACMKCDELIVTYQNSKRRGYFGLCYRLLSKVDGFVKQFITFQAPCEHHLLFVQRLKVKLWGEFVMLQRWTQIIVYLTKITFLFRRNK